jgi:hypothetical protein|mmetsp:Transcript_97001/g.141912  ORF Transcript_97001/g.141912 Transcript_97001/m.141912 type:complete len:88 (+) Transcript_97001:146-409(+)
MIQYDLQRAGKIDNTSSRPEIFPELFILTEIYPYDEPQFYPASFGMYIYMTPNSHEDACVQTLLLVKSEEGESTREKIESEKKISSR